MRSICSRGKHSLVPALKQKQPQSVDLKTICRFLSNQPDFSDALRADWFPVKSIGDVNCLVLLKIRPTLQSVRRGLKCLIMPHLKSEPRYTALRLLFGNVSHNTHILCEDERGTLPATIRLGTETSASSPCLSN